MEMFSSLLREANVKLGGVFALVMAAITSILSSSDSASAKMLLIIVDAAAVIRTAKLLSRYGKVKSFC